LSLCSNNFCLECQCLFVVDKNLLESIELAHVSTICGGRKYIEDEIESKSHFFAQSFYRMSVYFHSKPHAERKFTFITNARDFSNFCSWLFMRSRNIASTILSECCLTCQVGLFDSSDKKKALVIPVFIIFSYN
jgi:hypothetical protein